MWFHITPESVAEVVASGGEGRREGSQGRQGEPASAGLAGGNTEGLDEARRGRHPVPFQGEPASAGLALFARFFRLAFDHDHDVEEEGGSAIDGVSERAEFRQRFKLMFRLRDDELSQLGATLGSMASSANGE